LKKTLLALFLGLALAGGAYAAPCTIDQVPGATLLLPYFEVDIDDPAGVDTIFTVNNASATAVLAHVVVWTDMSIEALDFNIYLTGYDMQTVSMGLMIRDGLLPVTATDGQDPTDTISPQGPISQDINYASCGGVFPYDPLTDDYLEHLQSILTGGPSSFYGGNCGGWDYDDGIARGYVTLDAVNACSLLKPCDPGYIEAYLTRQNVLWGDWFIIEGAENFAQGDAMVALEAIDSGVVYPFPNGTFWGRCFGNNPGTNPDYREPLPSIFGAVFFNNAAFSGGTDLVVWRDSLTPTDSDGFSCSGAPGWFPLGQNQVVAFDQEENPEEGGCTISPCPEELPLFILEAQRVPVEDLALTPQSGWIYLNLDQGSDHGQAWVISMFKAEGRYSAGIAANQILSTCQIPALVPPLPVN